MSFKDILGHKRPIAILQRAIQGGRVPSAYLFEGPNGVGKRLIALNIAKALNCEGKIGPDCCDSCIPCRKIDKGVHPDVSILEPQATSPKVEPSLKIEQARDAQRDLSLKPYEGRKKVYIFDQAEKMTEQCENALLKTLEEPTGEALFVLITSSPYSLLPTVLSRAQRIRFDPLPQGEVASFLRRTQSWEEEKSNFIASLAGGSLGQALRMDAEDLLSARDEALADLTSVLKGGTCRTLDLAEAWAKEKERLSERLQYLLIWVRDLRIYQSTQEDHLLVNRDRADRIREEAKLFPQEVLTRFFDIVQEAIRATSRYANARLSLECMFFRMRSAFQEGEGMIYAKCGEN
jgi:DNA polymerase-3 subunit delta'